ncbi:MAG: hypothetical protein JSS81_21795 [Acidobacteria bacterium]|nr:hypothetical protein [Acidobacteriota bacterium]
MGVFVVFVLLGLAAFFFGLLDFSKSGKRYGISYLRPVIGMVVGMAFLGTGLYFSAGSFRQTYGFRNIPVGRVRGFRVFGSKSESEPGDSNFVVYDNPEKTQAALLTLKNCREIRRNHEHFEDGYKLQLLITGEPAESDYFLSVYRISSARSGKQVVMPHLGPNKNLNLGDYECPEFQSFVRENIDPLFQPKNNQPK